MRKHAWIKIILALCLAFCAVGCAPSVAERSAVKEQSAPQAVSAPARVILLAGDDACLGYAQSYRLQDGRMSEDVSAQKYAEYEAGYENVLISYRTMLNSTSTHAQSNGFVPVRLGQGYVHMGLKNGSFGVEVGLAEVMNAYYPNQTTYIVKFAGGGTSEIASQWSPIGGSYYNEMTRFFAQSLALLTEQGIDFEVSAFCFMQGESDARYNYNGYEAKLREFADAVKAQYAPYAPSNGMAFVDVGVAQFFVHYDRLNAMKKAMADEDARGYFVDTVAAGLNGQYDSIQRRYLDSISTVKLGQLIGKTVRESFEPVALATPLRPTKRPVAYSVNGQTFGAFSDGLQAQATWNAYTSDNYLYVEADVRDGLIVKEDGFEITFGMATNQRTIPFRTQRVTLFADGSLKTEQYYDGAFQFTSTILGYKTYHDYLTDDGETVSGYRVAFLMPVEDTAAVQVALLNRNGVSTVRKPFRGLNAKDEDYGSWVRATKQGIEASPYRKGAFFGGNGVLADVGLWDMSLDTEEAKRMTLLQNEWLNVAYMTEAQGEEFYFETEISATAVLLGEMWGKFGIQLTTATNTGLFYYLDAYGNGMQMFGCNLGYATRVSAGVFDNYVTSAEHVVSAPAAYQEGNFVKFAIYRKGTSITMLFNDKVVTTLDTFAAIGTRDVYVGIGSFNITLAAKNYNLLTGAAAASYFDEVRNVDNPA